MGANAFGEVMCAWGWWDCPRSGIAMIDGQPFRFDCEFSEELDDFPVVYKLWPIDQAQLKEELALWRRWVDWRGQFDAGSSPEPFEQELGYDAFRERLQSLAIPPENAPLAVPEWRLDPNRSFAGRIPKHLVRWATA